MSLADLGPVTDAVSAALDDLARRNAVARTWHKDPALWKPNPAEQTEIVDRLGWLELPSSMAPAAEGLRAFADEVRGEGVRHVVLCGMGGSSLAPEVFRLTFGSAQGAPILLVLDSTDPGAVRAVDAQIDPARTLFLISSKSGGTTEVMAFLAHFWERSGSNGRAFCAITDPGTSLERLATERGFRRVFTNPPDIGGRYSALSLFGLVPAALIGMDVPGLLARAEREAELGRMEDVRSNPSAWLGAVMGASARAGRNKLSVLTSPALESFGLWVEQLIAESTGKQGTGIVPVVGERLNPETSVYSDDRCFVALRLEGDDNTTLDRVVQGLRGRHPVVVERLDDRLDVGAAMWRWEMATAIAGAVLGIQPFDQPNVQESKDNTARVLREAAASGQVAPPPLEVLLEADDAEGIESFLAQTGDGDYVAIHAYLTPTEETEQRLQVIRALMRDELRLATTLGFGPRFLHSTGQLHKGGPASGVFLQITYQPGEDLPVPGQRYTFGELIAAQALGDLQSLAGRELRVARVDLGNDIAGGLRRFERAVAAFPGGL